MHVDRHMHVSCVPCMWTGTCPQSRTMQLAPTPVQLAPLLLLHSHLWVGLCCLHGAQGYNQAQMEASG